MTWSPIPEAPGSVFICACGELERLACANEPFYKEYEGNRYCVLHYPGNDKSADFDKALRRKLDAQEFDFRGVWFPDMVSFHDQTFTEKANFKGAVFTKGGDFNHANFNKNATFNRAVFDAEVYFHNAEFNGNAYFINAKFRANADFQFSKFNQKTDFYFATFSADAKFRDVTFKDYVRFSGNQSNQVFSGDLLDLEHARIEKPDRISFHTVTLFPHWFVNVDSRSFEFINVTWRDISRQEIHSFEEIEGKPHFRLLSVCYRNLAVNAEDNHRYDEASRFRYMAMDVRRWDKWKGFAFWRLEWVYWAASGYGERILRAFFGLIGIWILFTLVYWSTPFVERVQRPLKVAQEPIGPYIEQIVPMDFGDACVYSLGVMTLQKQEPRPVHKTTEMLVIIETVLGPLQGALLALAIRRKLIR